MGLQSFITWTLSQLVKTTRRRLLLALGLMAFLKLNFPCNDDKSRLVITNLCSTYAGGQLAGNLCEDLCEPKGKWSVGCQFLPHDKKTMFYGKLSNYSTVFKYVKKTSTGIEPFYFSNTSKPVQDMENDISKMIKTNAKLLFNLSINDEDAKKMSQTPHKRYNRVTEMENVWPLLQDREYLGLLLYEKYQIFPTLLGTCGSLYALERFEIIPANWHLITIYDTRIDWYFRIRVSLMIMDFLVMIEEHVPEPLHICNIQLNHFAVVSGYKKVKYLEIDFVHPYSLASKKTGDGSDCKSHSDCDFLDCRSFCDLGTFKCQHGVANNNLQIVCEKLFLGLALSGRVMVPGFLMGPQTPRVLVEVLELCANPFQEVGKPRAKATPEVRKRLYDLLRHL